ncbi:MAG: hypothetical protein P8N76_16255 [Pirellulaceae bacterium]|nr:hypothetical protein [Pirellulaceae bacterium]
MVQTYAPVDCLRLASCQKYALLHGRLSEDDRTLFAKAVFQRVEELQDVSVLQLPTQAAQEDHVKWSFRKSFPTVAFEYLNIAQASHSFPRSLHHQGTTVDPNGSLLAISEALGPGPQPTANVKHSL